MEKQLDVYVIEAKEGNKEAFGKLFELTNQKAYYTALKITENPRDAEDMVQEAYVKAFTSLDTLNDAAKFEKWLNRIVANNCRDLAKKRKPDLFSAYENEDSDTSFEESLENLDLSDLPQEVTDSKAIKNIVMECIDKLPFEQRMCVVMFYYNELTIIEIAESLSVPVGTVKSRLNKARKALKKQFEYVEKTDNIKFYSASFPAMVAMALRFGGKSCKIPALSLLKITKNVPNLFLNNGISSILKTIGISGILKRLVFGVGAAAIITGGSMAARNVADEKKAEPVITSAVVSQIPDEQPDNNSSNRNKKSVFSDKREEDTLEMSAIAVSDRKNNTYFINADGIFCVDKNENKTKISSHKPLNLCFGDCLMYIYNRALYQYKDSKLKKHMEVEGEYIYGIKNSLVSISADRNSAYFIDVDKKTCESVEEGGSEFKLLGKMLYYRSADNKIKRASFNKDSSITVEEVVSFSSEDDMNIPYTVRGNKIYYTSFDSDISGIIYVKDIPSGEIETVKVEGGITDYSASQNRIYYSLSSGGLYLYSNDEGVVKLADGNFYCSATSNGSMIWCNTDDSAAYLIKSGSSELINIENGSDIIEFSIVKNTLYYRGDNGYDSVRL
ncbi:MAG: sigma-70 family RNA polymerase sigma factor [Eubacterium sp.]|nr:sigma-70 family RNA polymerase sigma factor [Eubacterium sp.]